MHHSMLDDEMELFFDDVNWDTKEIAILPLSTQRFIAPSFSLANESVNHSRGDKDSLSWNWYCMDKNEKFINISHRFDKLKKDSSISVG